MTTHAPIVASPRGDVYHRTNANGQPDCRSQALRYRVYASEPVVGTIGGRKYRPCPACFRRRKTYPYTPDYEVCPDGCGCVITTDGSDADVHECGCTGRCTMGVVAFEDASCPSCNAAVPSRTKHDCPEWTGS